MSLVTLQHKKTVDACFIERDINTGAVLAQRLLVEQASVQIKIPHILYSLAQGKGQGCLDAHFIERDIDIGEVLAQGLFIEEAKAREPHERLRLCDLLAGEGTPTRHNNGMEDGRI